MKISKHEILLVLITLSFINMAAAQVANPLWKNKEFAIYGDSVVQGKFTGKALSSSEITSNYKSPANEFLSPDITFKFSINGKDNEMKPGMDHHFISIGTSNLLETPVIEFGKQSMAKRAIPDNTYLKANTALKIRLDMKDVFDQFKKNGYYTTFNGDKIYKQDFKGVYIAGNAAPLSWDFDNLVNKPGLKMSDDNNDGIYETTIILNDQKNERLTSSHWKISKDLSAYPHYKSDYSISDALYNLAIEEMSNALEPDSTFRTGKEWAGVWTRDISYSIILAMAHLQPNVAKISLLKKVNRRGRIIQDTGTGGAWPASTDRMIWAVAAYELYKVTGDKAWLQQSYTIIKNSAADDEKVAYDLQTGLVKGESSFLDWREQTYPKWMQPADIFESECLGTNAVHYQANIVLSNMASLLNDKASSEKYKLTAQRIKAGVNKYLWVPERKHYGQYRYGRNSKILSPRSEALGESLCVLFGIADVEKAKTIIGNTPLMDFGIPCIFPQIPGIPPYHNNAVWPFVQSYYALASAKAGNEEAVMASIAAIYRPAALWATNKENFVASNGDFAGTQINSDNMLWSLSGSISLVHKLLFGIQFNNTGISFHPFVPHALQGKRSLTNFKYRQAVFDIEMEGYGNEIKSFMVDDKVASPNVSAETEGRHTIKIILANNQISGSKINVVKHHFSPEVPVVNLMKNSLSWNKIKDAKRYIILKNGKEIFKTEETHFDVLQKNFAEYQVIVEDEKGFQSFASEPLLIAGNNVINIYQTEKNATRSTYPYKGFSGDGFVEISKTQNVSVTIPITVKTDGIYTIDFRYANGNGPVNTENKCAIRTLKEGNRVLGTVILPQRGTDEWSNWGWSNCIHANLKKGKHILTSSLEKYNENMNGEINQAMLDYLRIIKMK